MTITAKYDGKCTKCGGKIVAGEKINWEKGRGAWHTDCAAAKEKAAAREAAAPYMIRRGSGYGGQPYCRGEVIPAPKYIQEKGVKYLYIIEAKKQYIREDGMSFGVGDDSGYIYTARCREATAEEATPLIEQERQAAERKAAKAELRKIKEEIQTAGDRPEGMNTPQGDKIFDTFNIYGGGDCFVVGEEHIWYVQNNGMDGDDWDLNNVKTGGAGAIGWRVARTDELIGRLQKLQGVLK